MTQFTFEAIGTTWQIDIYNKIDSEQESVLLSSIKNRIEIFEQTYSRFREDSLVSQMSQKEGSYLLPDDAKEMLELYMELYKKTNGLFTPLIGETLSDAGYDATYSLKQKNSLKEPLKWEDALVYTFPHMLVKKPVLLDFGAGGKGYIIDIVSNTLEEAGIEAYSVDAGGDIRHKNKEALRVGLENPFNTKEVIGFVELQNQSMCGSAGTRRKWGDFTHIINPKTLSSPKDIVAVWTIAKNTLLADCLSTCLFFVEPEILEEYEFDFCIVKSDGSFQVSKNFKGEMFK